MLDVMEPLVVLTKSTYEHSVCSTAQYIKRICDANFLVSGQSGVRFEPGPPFSQNFSARWKTFFKVVNLVMFGSPEAHRKALDTTRVDDRVVQVERRENLIDRINCEWNEYTVFSTVMLAVNIAVPFVHSQTSAILVSYLSTLCATGSLIVTLVFARQVNVSQRYPHRCSVSILFNRLTFIIYYIHHTPLFILGMLRSSERLERLVLMLSLLFTFLIWGCVSN
ncbi:hypothetical protein DFJ58DRAFT_183311 [Suillus subalutaceus]|uniref:uncharacterized protein n=1 Tax=Suillus subalutaceus TaxID=48586 RepID=UPI001B87F89B|nr:uncharacterized protein DFJ58DRAFT_183311 [Suillus subalutaceus]KAG1876662.1 hypothetical protein DFJ58DRAFT_183311 [Suillus subalutaceus]